MTTSCAFWLRDAKLFSYLPKGLDLQQSDLARFPEKGPERALCTVTHRPAIQLASLFVPLGCGFALIGPSSRLPLSADELRTLPGVDSVELRLAPASPTRRIIHILDWHFVDREAFQADTPDANYEDHLTLVRTVQANQRRLLESLGVKAVYVESLTPDNLEQFKRQLAVMRPPIETKSGSVSSCKPSTNWTCCGSVPLANWRGRGSSMFCQPSIRGLRAGQPDRRFWQRLESLQRGP